MPIPIAIEVTAGDVADVVGGTVVGREVNSTEIVGEYVTVSTEGIGTEVADADVVGITFIATEVDGAEVVGKETVDEEAVGKEITSWQFTTAVLGWKILLSGHGVSPNILFSSAVTVNRILIDTISVDLNA
mmetsp:Transcript_12020/g.23950  ORF Transcript_12020/g.23950 Transcript_12020/m.23950 type:complete len:131 (+) Transcript_12020:266-658(+)